MMMTDNDTFRLCINPEATEQFLAAVHSRDPISGMTHNFYRYPARFSPQFARAAIETFTHPGDVVLDPFMGGATTLVEAVLLGRIGIGLDINELACFLARVKTTPLTGADIRAIRLWLREAIPNLNMRRIANRPHDWIAAGYQRNISTRQTWPIRKALELALDQVSLLNSASQQNFVRAVLLRTGQWALDCRSDVPRAAEFRIKLEQFLDEMIEGIREYRQVAALSDSVSPDNCSGTRTLILRRSADGIEDEPAITQYGPPKLVLTSPPYPGVHVLYHRWQIFGRRETPAPFWITNTFDGNGLSYYTFGDRRNPNLRTYFDTAQLTFRSIARIAQQNTLIVQMVAFSDASWQLPQYLETMRAAGLEELKMSNASDSRDGRLWRIVPNRKWYADQRGLIDAAEEVVLFHRPRI